LATLIPNELNSDENVDKGKNKNGCLQIISKKLKLIIDYSN